MAEIEQRGDALRGKLVTRLAGVLVTPIDREDLFRLSRSIDDVLDNLRDFVREWDLYGIEANDAYLSLDRRHRERARRPSPGCADDRKGPERHESALPWSARNRQTRSAVSTMSSLGGSSAASSLWRSSKCRELLRRLDVVGLRLNEAADVFSDAAVKRRA